MTETIYESIIQTKTGSFIPLLKNGKTLESKYNPEREAETLYQQIEKPYNFYVIAGTGSGIFANYISEKNPDAIIICVENSSQDFEFLSQLDSIKKCKTNTKINFTTIDNLNNTLLESYVPALYGDIKIIFQKVWATEFPEYFEKTKTIIQNTIKEISADYSVQAHFGKIWQKNIMSNAKLISSKNTSSKFTPDLTKTAVIIAAGPSLDETITRLLENKDKYFIFSTDTAYQVLLKHNIIPQAVVSIDGQLLSCNHFINEISSATSFLFDLCANSGISKKICAKTNKLYFFTNGHPLSNSLSNFAEPQFPLIYTGSGTVTIAALDIAIKCGFSKIEIFGADFGYINNKPYSKGTYLDSLYSKNANLLQTTDKTFSKLMFRTELKTISETKKTTAVLESYRLSLEDYLNKMKVSFSFTDNYYTLSSTQGKQIDFCNPELNFNSFLTYLNNRNYVPLLPYIAWLRNKPEHKNADFETLVNLAYKDIVSYN